nr:hypothetical protein [Lentilactobacillus otakiensis]
MQDNKQIKTTFIKKMYMAINCPKQLSKKILKKSADEVFGNKIVQEVMAELAKM